MRFAKCYTAIMRCPDLSLSAKVVYACLKTYTSEKDHTAWPAQKTIAKQNGIGERGVRKALRELWCWEILQWNSGYSGRANIYYLTDQKGAARIARGDGPMVPPDPRLMVPPKETHSNGALQEEPVEYQPKRRAK